MPPKGENDIRDTLEKEVSKYRIKFLTCLIIQIPILILMWIIPYTFEEVLTYLKIINGVPLYIFVLFILSSIVQFYLGADFYKGAYKAMMHGQANMDVLVVLGTTAAWLYGLLMIFFGYDKYEQMDKEILSDPTADPEDAKNVWHAVHEHAHNFEISSTLITVILLGKWMESFSKK